MSEWKIVLFWTLDFENPIWDLLLLVLVHFQTESLIFDLTCQTSPSRPLTLVSSLPPLPSQLSLRNIKGADRWWCWDYRLWKHKCRGTWEIRFNWGTSIFQEITCFDSHCPVESDVGHHSGTDMKNQTVYGISFYLIYLNTAQPLVWHYISDSSEK